MQKKKTCTQHKHDRPQVQNRQLLTKSRERQGKTSCMPRK